MKYFKCISSLILVIIIFTSSTLNIIAQNDTVNNMFTIEEKIINEESEFFKQNIKAIHQKRK